eukprot:IDg3309t1
MQNTESLDGSMAQQNISDETVKFYKQFKDEIDYFHHRKLLRNTSTQSHPAVNARVFQSLADQPQERAFFVLKAFGSFMGCSMWQENVHFIQTSLDNAQLRNVASTMATQHVVANSTVPPYFKLFSYTCELFWLYKADQLRDFGCARGGEPIQRDTAQRHESFIQGNE